MFISLENITSDNIRTFWNNMSFPFEEVFGAVEIMLENSTVVDSLSIGHHSKFGTIQLRNYLAGQCFTIEVSAPLAAKTYLYLALKMDQFIALPLCVHPQRAEMGINEHYWLTPSQTVTINQYMAFCDIVLKRYINAKAIDCNPDPDYSYFDCVKQWGQNVYVNLSEISQFNICQGVTKGD